MLALLGLGPYKVAYEALWDSLWGSTNKIAVIMSSLMLAKKKMRRRDVLEQDAYDMYTLVDPLVYYNLRVLGECREGPIMTELILWTNTSSLYYPKVQHFACVHSTSYRLILHCRPEGVLLNSTPLVPLSQELKVGQWKLGNAAHMGLHCWWLPQADEEGITCRWSSFQWGKSTHCLLCQRCFTLCQAACSIDVQTQT